MNIDIFTRLLLKAGKWTLVIVIIAVVLNHWEILKIPIPHLVNVLYAYILLNGLAAGPYIYLEKRATVVASKVCPQCGVMLESSMTYNCPNCGKLEFKKQ